MARAGRGSRPRGLAELQRRGSVTELLFLYECATLEPTQLRPIALGLGLTVQAASHQFRRLAARGLAELKDGRYRPTVAGVAWLHGALGVLREDLNARLDRLYVVRSCRAIAAVDLAADAPVHLELRDGLLIALPGARGASRGRAGAPARRGDLVRVDRLEGILPLSPAPVRVLVVPARGLGDPAVPARLARRLRDGGPGLVAAQGLEALHLLRRAGSRSPVRFGVAAACREASRVGVASTVVVLEGQLPDLLSEFGGPDPPPLEVSTVPAEAPRERGAQGRKVRDR